MNDEYIDWQLLEKRRLAEEREATKQAINDLQASVAMLHDLERTEQWKHICNLLKNTSAAKQQEAMKATDPTSMARAFGYMAACLDVVALPTTLAQQLEGQLASLTSRPT